MIKRYSVDWVVTLWGYEDLFIYNTKLLYGICHTKQRTFVLCGWKVLSPSEQQRVQATESYVQMKK